MLGGTVEGVVGARNLCYICVIFVLYFIFIYIVFGHYIDLMIG